jgi:hypothetical protein
MLKNFSRYIKLITDLLFLPVSPVSPHFQSYSSPRRNSRFSNLLNQELNYRIPTSCRMQIMRHHNQLDIWQESLCDLPNFLLLIIEQFAGTDLYRNQLCLPNKG